MSQMLTTKAKVKLHNDVTNNETIHYLLHIKEIFQFIFFVTCGSLKDSLSVLTSLISV